MVVDIQGGGLNNPYPEDRPGLNYMPGREVRNPKAVDLVNTFRAKQIPVIFIQEVHKPRSSTSAASWTGTRARTASRANAGPSCIPDWTRARRST